MKRKKYLPPPPPQKNEMIPNFTFALPRIFHQSRRIANNSSAVANMEKMFHVHISGKEYITHIAHHTSTLINMSI